MVVDANFAMTAAVVIPVILLAAGVDARTFERKTRELRSAAYPIAQTAEIMARLLHEIPSESGLTPDQARKAVDEALTRSYRKVALTILTATVRELGYIIGCLLWACTVLALSIAQVLLLVWLASPHPQPDSGLAVLSVGAVAAGVMMLCASPIVRLTVNAPAFRESFVLFNRSRAAIEAEMRRIRGAEAEEVVSTLQSDARAYERSRVREARLLAARRVVRQRNPRERP
jgi:hypothetical protein